jgi:glutamyl-tRNA synthetase/nondiscriminating glutamyl-tRNA synthetase
LSDDFSYDPSGIEKHLRDERLGKFLSLLKEDFSKMDYFSAADIEPVLRQRAEKEGIKAALLIHALRMLVVGTPVSPGIFEVLELIGKNKTVERMERLEDVVG